MHQTEQEYADTGYLPIDQEHRALSQAFIELVESVNHDAASKLRPIMRRIQLGATLHFSHEQDLMAQVHYPDLTRHSAAHQAFLANLNARVVQIERTGLDSESRRWALVKLPEWFRFHIRAYDVALGKFLLSQAPVPNAHWAPLLQDVARGPV